MAFNPLGTFHKNKRFWMAAILMICMVSFVFCTGMRGDMSERLPQMFGFGRGGTAVANLDGHSITRRDLEDLKAQRNLANDLMMRCADLAFKNLSKEFFEENKKVGDADKIEARRERLADLYKKRATVAYRKSKPSQRYFDIGVKFDDLLEFRLWQAEADRLGIKIEEEHVDLLFRMEFFGFLTRDDMFLAQRDGRPEGGSVEIVSCDEHEPQPDIRAVSGRGRRSAGKARRRGRAGAADPGDGPPWRR